LPTFFIYALLCHVHSIDPQRLNGPPAGQPALCLEFFFTFDSEAEPTLVFKFFVAPGTDDGLLLGLELFLTPDPDAISCDSVINTPLLSNFGSAEKAPTPV
jgi:hypothetical protein